MTIMVNALNRAKQMLQTLKVALWRLYPSLCNVTYFSSCRVNQSALCKNEPMLDF